MRVISSSTARCIFSLLGEQEQCWRERNADGVVIVLQVMRVQGPVLAGGFLDVRFSGLRDVVVVGLIPCERSYSARVPRSSLAKCAGYLFTTSWKKKPRARRMNKTIGEKKDSKKRKWVAENQTHNMSAWRWRMRWREVCAAHAKLEPWASYVTVSQRENVTCDVCCSHLPWVAADCFQL